MREMREVGRDIILLASACFACKATSNGDEALPSVFVEIGNVFGHDAFPNQSACKAGVEAITSSYCADNVINWRRLEVVATRRSTYSYLLRARSANEELAMLAYIPIIYNARVARGKHDIEVVCAASDDSALAEVMQDDGRQQLKLIAMAATEVDVIINDGIGLFCLLEHLSDERTHADACCIVGAEEHHIAALHIGQCPGRRHTRRLLVEDVACIAVVCKESKAYGTLLALAHLKVFGADVVGSKKVYRLPSHNVIAGIADEGAGNTCATYADDAVEAAASMHRCFRLSITKEDVENRLAYSDNFSCLFHRFNAKRAQS